MRTTTTNQSSDWKAGFLFVGNQLALDFLDTRPVLDGQPTELLVDLSALLRWFTAADLLDSRRAAELQRQWGRLPQARRTVEAMREFRERLRKALLAWERGAAVHRAMTDELNSLMADYPLLTRLRAAGSDVSLKGWFEPQHPEDPLAHSAATLFANVDRSRVRKCGQCVLHFNDTSKKGTRRSCSMKLCGNRAKVAAYAARKRRRAVQTNLNVPG